MRLPRRENICPNCFHTPYIGGACPKCHYTATESEAGLLAAGVILANKYLLGRLLGVGGFGVTYLALDMSARKTIAIKEYFPTTMAMRDADERMKFKGSGDRRVFDYGYKSFRREVDYLSRFKGEPTVVQALDTFDANGTTYLVMEYLDGVTLKVLQRNLGGKLQVPYAAEIFRTVLLTLGKIHAKGLLHRDISPENIFVTKAGNKKVIDFGAMKEIYAKEANAAILLKPGFAPPEQYSNMGNQGPWTDLYALAASFYYAITGIKPPDAKQREAGAAIPKLQSVVPDLDAKLAYMIEKAMTLNVKDRYRHAGEMMSAFPHVAHQTGQVGGIISKLSGIPYVEIERGSKAGERWPIPQNVDIKIGRQPGINNIVILDQSISRSHGVIRYDSESGMFLLRDISTNGIFSVGGARFASGRETALSPDSRFFLSKENIIMRVGLG